MWRMKFPTKEAEKIDISSSRSGFHPLVMKCGIELLRWRNAEMRGLFPKYIYELLSFNGSLFKFLQVWEDYKVYQMLGLKTNCLVSLVSRILSLFLFVILSTVVLQCLNSFGRKLSSAKWRTYKNRNKFFVQL